MSPFFASHICITEHAKQIFQKTLVDIVPKSQILGFGLLSLVLTSTKTAS